MELSHKLEGDLLNSTKSSSLPESAQSQCLSGVMTRSKSKVNGVAFLNYQTQIESERKVNKDINIYLKKQKTVQKNLETIFEDPVYKKGSLRLIGSSKIKRSIYLKREFRYTSKQKSALRKLKIKRLGKKLKLVKMTDYEFQSKMSQIDRYLNDNVKEPNCDNQGQSVNIDMIICDNENDTIVWQLNSKAYGEERDIPYGMHDTDIEMKYELKQS